MVRIGAIGKCSAGHILIPFIFSLVCAEAAIKTIYKLWPETADEPDTSGIPPIVLLHDNRHHTRQPTSMQAQKRKFQEKRSKRNVTVPANPTDLIRQGRTPHPTCKLQLYQNLCQPLGSILSTTLPFASSSSSNEALGEEKDLYTLRQNVCYF